MAYDNNQGGMPGADNVTFKSWLEGQSDEVKSRFEQGTQGLRSALKSERESTKTLSGQLKELQTKAEKDSDLAKQLSEMQAKLDESDRRSAFVSVSGADLPRESAFASSSKSAGQINGSTNFSKSLVFSFTLFPERGMDLSFLKKTNIKEFLYFMKTQYIEFYSNFQIYLKIFKKMHYNIHSLLS